MLVQIKYDREKSNEAVIVTQSDNREFDTPHTIKVVAVTTVKTRSRRGFTIDTSALTSMFTKPEYYQIQTQTWEVVTVTGSDLAAIGIKPQDIPGVEMVFSNIGNGNTHIYSRLSSGTCYSINTPKKVVDILELARQKGHRIKIWSGNLKTGKVWGDIETGSVGRSTGDVKIPLLIHNNRSTGGGGIMDDCIVRVEYANRELGSLIWKSDNFDMGTSCPWCNAAFTTEHPAPAPKFVCQRLPRGETHRSFCAWCRRKRLSGAA